MYWNQLRGGPYSKEMAAIRVVTALHTAQTQYLEIHGSYAATLRDLGDLIPADLASGKKSGYSFQMRGTVDHYIITFSPIDGNSRRSFYSDETLVIRGAEPAGPHSREIR